LYPDAEIQVVVNFQQETLGPDLEVVVAPTDGDPDTEAVEESVYAALKDTKALLGRAFLTSDEAEEEKDENRMEDE
jgi:hypothetical protein